MNSLGRHLSSLGRPLVTGLLVLWLFAGCKNMFTPQHKVTVDAICAPAVEKPAGQSFRVVTKTTGATQGQVELRVVKACIVAALAHAGMYEAPDITPADIIIEATCGQDLAPRADPSTKETFLELSARTNKGRSMDVTREPEIWNVRVSIFGLSGRVEPAMPLLSAVASSYTATDTKFQTMIEVPKNNVSISSVRETALKILDASPAGTRAPSAPASPAPATASAPGAASPEK